MKKIAFEGVYIESDEGGERYYCRSPLDGVRAQAYIDTIEAAPVVYDGVADDVEYDDSQDELMVRVLSDPKVQEVMLILGAELVSVSPPDKPPKFPKNRWGR